MLVLARAVVLQLEVAQFIPQRTVATPLLYVVVALCEVPCDSFSVIVLVCVCVF